MNLQEQSEKLSGGAKSVRDSTVPLLPVSEAGLL